MNNDLPPFNKDSDTSKAAAESMADLTAEQQIRVYRMIFAAKSHGMICEEVEVALNMPHQTASARINDLHRSQHIRDSGNRRSTSSGRDAIVWVVTREAVT